ncbi:hypothetical protein GGS21DRAFT_489495 [Xylaria nigripes]|nr:hypothetical protein GGS21DRAFT_489495 [Xylaria nigripes]
MPVKQNVVIATLILVIMGVTIVLCWKGTAIVGAFARNMFMAKQTARQQAAQQQRLQEAEDAEQKEKLSRSPLGVSEGEEGRKA